VLFQGEERKGYHQQAL